MGRLLGHVVRHQKQDAISLWHWIRRRDHGVGPGDRAFGYASEQAPIMFALLGVIVVETTVVGFLLPWWWIHVLDGIAVVQVLAAIASLKVRPHVLRADTLVVRSGPMIHVDVPLELVVSVRAELKHHDGTSTYQVRGDELCLVQGNQTDLTLELSDPVSTTRSNGEPLLVRVLRFRADEPRAAADAIREAVERRRTALTA
ncbi:hypothetical protein [Amycolatopsis suaedae]|uniref:Uncharacterized protein n=1 Tax=Amycolatopsis suaedae TaxID=2510978 RepID=A0A4Q7J159_9PSEU|nr:hypothetical protein [Amycolatopsis suaedae]RZQ60559.1 hypothetical protein EWH70_28200 [Amycolatopsis suaedae]